jgi:hypothetical protein
MPILTYAELSDIEQTCDREICTVLQALARPPIVEETRVWVRPRWWQTPRLQAAFTILWPRGEGCLGPHWEMVYFTREPHPEFLSTPVPKELVLAYLCGLLRAEQHAII